MPKRRKVAPNQTTLSFGAGGQIKAKGSFQPTLAAFARRAGGQGGGQQDAAMSGSLTVQRLDWRQKFELLEMEMKHVQAEFAAELNG